MNSEGRDCARDSRDTELNTPVDDAAGPQDVVTALVTAFSCDPLGGSQSPLDRLIVVLRIGQVLTEM